MNPGESRALQWHTSSGIYDFNAVFAQDHTPDSLSCQTQIGIGGIGSDSATNVG
jgi:hypothetical protein